MTPDLYFPGAIAAVSVRVGWLGRPVMMVQRHTQKMRFHENGDAYWEKRGRTQWRRASRGDIPELAIFLKADECW